MSHRQCRTWFSTVSCSGIGPALIPSLQVALHSRSTNLLLYRRVRNILLYIAGKRLESHKRGCSGMQVGGLGDGDAGPSLRSCMEKINKVTKVATNDAASVNGCISKKEQTVMIDSRSHPERYRAHLDLPCFGHQCCLMTRPALEGFRMWSFMG